MPRHGKRYRADVRTIDRSKQYDLAEAVGFLQNFKKTKFDQSVEICMHLGIDPRQADQIVRGSVSLPHGIGVSRRVIAFCSPDKVEAAKEAGAIEAGGEELVEKIEGGWMDFDVAIAEPPMMRVISKLGRVLGPRGLMPSPKSGTVTPDVADAVREYVAGKVEFRNDDGGNVHAVVGKQSFGMQELRENAQYFIDTIKKMRPASTKGLYIKRATMSLTMSPGIDLAV